MNYALIYARLIERAKTREWKRGELYFEEHHVIPRCLGGSDEDRNLVKLTPEEHFIAHELLVKIYPEHPGLIYALTKLIQAGAGQVRNNRLYGWHKRRLSAVTSEQMRERWQDPDQRDKFMQNIIANSPWNNPETRAKHAAGLMRAGMDPGYQRRRIGALRNAKRRPEFRKWISDNNPMHHHEVRAKISGINNHMTSRIESRLKVSIAKGGRPFRCVETGSVYQLQMDAVRWLIGQGNAKADQAGLIHHLKGRRSVLYGYHFEYLKEASAA